MNVTARIRAATLLLVAVLSACGGGASFNDDGGDGGTAVPPVEPVASVNLSSDRSVLSPDANTPDGGVLVTAIAVDAAGRVVAGVPVQFTGSGVVLQVTQATTDATGRAFAIATSGGNPNPRSATVSAAVDEISSAPLTIEIRRLFASLSLTSDRLVLSPDANTPDTGVLVTAVAVDESGRLVAGVPVQFTASGVVLQVTQATTDATGRAFAIATSGGNPNPRSATVSATSDGVATAPLTIEVRRLSTLALEISNAQLPPDAENPAQGVTLTVTLRDSTNAPLGGIAVSFSADSGQIQVTSGTTDAQGRATAVLTTGGNPAPRTIIVSASANVGGMMLQSSRTIRVVERAQLVTILASSPNLPSSASQVGNGVRVTAVVRNAGNNLVENAPVQFTSTSGALQITRAVTDATGTAEAVLTTGGDPSLRNITVTANSAGTVSNVSISVVGTTVSINAPPSVTLNQSVPVVVTLRDSAGSAIPNRPITLSSELGNRINGQTTGASVQTDALGQASFMYEALIPGAMSRDTLTASAAGAFSTAVLGLSRFSVVLRFNPESTAEVLFGSSQPVIARLMDGNLPVANATIQFTVTRGALSAASAVTNASGEATVSVTANGVDGAGPFLVVATAPNNGNVSDSISAEFVAINPTQINLQAEPAKIGLNSLSRLRAVVRDANNNLVKNQRVDFVLSDATSGSLSAATGITDSQGAVSVNYRSSSTTSANDGVRVTARLIGAGGAQVATDDAFITVGGTALRITLGTGNTVIEDNPTTYKLPYSALVTDSAGNPAPPSTVFRLKVESLEYQKGFYILQQPLPAIIVPTVLPPLLPPAVFGCLTEDPEGTGIYVLANDTNSNGILDPGNVATVPETTELDENGVGDFLIEYPQDRGNWVRVRLTATASVDGTESLEVREFVLPISVPDAPNPPGNPSPYGVADNCADPN